MPHFAVALSLFLLASFSGVVAIAWGCGAEGEIALPRVVGSRPPIAARSAGVLIALSSVVGMTHVAVMSGWSRFLTPLIALPVYVFFAWFVISSINKARNWVRWLILVLGALSPFALISLLWFRIDLPAYVVREIYVTQTLMHGAAAILLVFPKSRRWFVSGQTGASLADTNLEVSPRCAIRGFR